MIVCIVVCHLRIRSRHEREVDYATDKANSIKGNNIRILERAGGDVVILGFNIPSETTDPNSAVRFTPDTDGVVISIIFWEAKSGQLEST